MAWRCRFLATRPSQDGRIIAEKGLGEELSGAPDTLVDFHTARRADDAGAHGAEERQVAPAAVDGVQVVRQRISVEEVLRAAGGGVWVGGAGRPESACELLSVARGISEGPRRPMGLVARVPCAPRAASLEPCGRDARAAAVQDAGCGLLLGLGAHAHD